MPTPFVLLSTEVVLVDPPLVAPSVTVVAEHVVSPSVPTPTLVHGRPT